MERAAAAPRMKRRHSSPRVDRQRSDPMPTLAGDRSRARRFRSGTLHESAFDAFTFSDNRLTNSGKCSRSDATLRSCAPVIKRIRQNDDALETPMVTSPMSLNDTRFVVMSDMVNWSFETRTEYLKLLIPMTNGLTAASTTTPALTLRNRAGL